MMDEVYSGPDPDMDDESMRLVYAGPVDMNIQSNRVVMNAIYAAPAPKRFDLNNMTSKCPVCGADISVKANFCINCGTSLRQSNQPYPNNKGIDA